MFGRLNLIFILLVQLNASALFAESTSSTQVKVAEPKNAVKKKKIGVDQSDFMPEANNFGLITTYAVSYNDLELVESKTYSHRLSFAGTYSFDKNWSSYLAASVRHQSYGNNIVKNHDSEPFHELSNINIGTVYNKMKPIRFIQRSSNTINLGLPVSRRSRVDKHVVNASLTNFMQTYSWNRFSLFNRASGNYVWQTQRFSLFQNDQLNRDWLLSDSFGITYMALKRVGVRFNYRIDAVRYLDRTWQLSFGNNLSVFANYFGFQVFVAAINNSYQENERVDLGYYDKFRRVYLGGVTYVF